MALYDLDATPPAPPPLNPLLFQQKSSQQSGFRLQDQNDETASIYSVYKQKIDAMFESDSSSKTTQNSVQARIEKMFSDITKDCNNLFPAPSTEIGCHTFSVDYLGSVTLQEKVTSLAGLQTPLKELYFSYKKNTKHKKTLTGRLEISSSGLKVQYQGEKGDLEQLNSFPTIAVWSAVKFVIQDHNYAFLPLITDPDNLDKQQLFQNFTQQEFKNLNNENHFPLFAVVMRKIGVQKQLECHAFICQTSEDAIVIAATLYKALMAHMKAKEKKPKSKNGVTCMSMTSSIYNEGVNSPPQIPVRPPRKKRGSICSNKSQEDTIETLGTSDTQPLLSDKEVQSKKVSKPKRAAPKAPNVLNQNDLDAILPYEEPSDENQIETIQKEIQEIKPQSIMDKFNTYRSTHQKQITAEIKQVMNETTNMGLKRVKSVRKRDEDIKGNDNSGDILTKVTIPRSGSFLNAGGLTRSNGQASGGSPLGFSELFNEFRLQEGLHSVDEILGVIIDPEGMSFNDLKPIYKEFLLKLALTLTKDELYQRSKLIMRRHKKKLMKSQNGKKRVAAYTKFKRLKHIFQKLKAVKDLQETSKKDVSEKTIESSLSSSSYDTRQFQPKEKCVTRRQSYRKRNQNRVRKDRVSTSEESDFFSLKRKKNFISTHNRNSSSGYVSCSECSYDSDSCTCVSADKCYCSLGDKNNKGHKKDLIYCGCDTDSCTDSNKCYCTIKKDHNGMGKSTIFEQLKERGFIPTSQEVKTPPNHRKLCKKNSNTKSTKSLLEYVPCKEQYYEKLKKNKKRGCENLAVDYELFSIANGKICNINSSLYGGEIDPKRNYSINSYKYTQNKKVLQSIPVKGCTEALSVKKSAEIAALFADIKLSQTTDIAHLIPKHIDPEILINYHNLNARRSSSRCSSRIDSTPINKMITNSLYTAKNAMYSANNGLYTIQSQSDDSKSSLERGSSRNKETDKVGSALENSLGYLP
ncbi:uncharacterized protein [Onthophagus taurus]|uniref:uncharacterized protein isoform X2 n=1 Tax=Onthophagus taurus TaxID=166361 RepID=UPI000C20A5A2|nr:uncharacterized protein LOC111418187 isoform X2 [Onthophagus taurus]